MSTSRFLLAALLLANLGYFAWTQGELAMFGMLPASFAEHEPQRVTQQIRPGALQIRKETATAPAEPAAGAAASALSLPDLERR